METENDCGHGWDCWPGPDVPADSRPVPVQPGLGQLLLLAKRPIGPATRAVAAKRIEPFATHRRRAVDISCSSGSKSGLVGPGPTEEHFGSSGPARTIPGTLVEFWEQVENVCLSNSPPTSRGNLV